MPWALLDTEQRTLWDMLLLLVLLLVIELGAKILSVLRRDLSSCPLLLALKRKQCVMQPHGTAMDGINCARGSDCHYNELRWKCYQFIPVMILLGKTTQKQFY